MVGSGAAASRHERILAVAAASWRGASALVLAQSIMRATDPVLLATLCAAATYAVISAASYLYRRSVGRIQAGLDCTIYIALMMTAHLADFFGGSTQLYDHLVMSALVLGLAPWRFWAVAGIGLLVAGCYSVTAHTPHTWNVPPDALVLAGNIMLGWFVANIARTAAGKLDHARAATVAEAAETGRLAQHTAYTGALGSRVLATLEHTRAAGVADQRLRLQLDRDVAWLSTHLTFDADQAPTTVAIALRKVAADKKALGLHIGLSLPTEAFPGLTEPTVAAAVELAVTEALANVAKHSGTNHVTVTVGNSAEGPVITIADSGHGFDPATARNGVGLRDCIQGPMTEVGGHAAIISSPGHGTVVTLHLPRPS